MAANNKPFGLRPSRRIDGSPWNGQAQYHYCSSSNTDDMYIGDLVKFDTTNRGNTTSDNLGNFPYVGMPAIAKYAAAGTNTRGVIVGFLPEPFFSESPTASLGLKYRKGSTDRIALVCVDTDVLYEIQEAATGTALTVAAIGKNVDVTVTAGTALAGLSKTVVDNGTEATTATLPLRLYGLKPSLGNDFGSASAPDVTVWEVLLNTSDLKNTTGL